MPRDAGDALRSQDVLQLLSWQVGDAFPRIRSRSPSTSLFLSGNVGCGAGAGRRRGPPG